MKISFFRLFQSITWYMWNKLACWGATLLTSVAGEKDNNYWPCSPWHPSSLIWPATCLIHVVHCQDWLFKWVASSVHWLTCKWSVCPNIYLLPLIFCLHALNKKDEASKENEALSKTFSKGRNRTFGHGRDGLSPMLLQPLLSGLQQ